ncbi:SRPBCC family protein [Saccharothrix syringae]|uniref:SRPBCC domain-containing protein n=1 Tax=Saccharothrix syringae TaxID=103733 RepID=A0A5Q0H738_SACSY|nr:SRPBCC family protein [Saccharothrix syringae]QFZ21764.1 SRPBCC domain-containing protein [Saccharothrix syringae]
MSETVVLRARAGVPPERVRRALTDPAELTAWLAEHAAVELPDRWQFWGRFTPEGDEPRQVLRHADDDSLRFTWHVGGEDTEVGVEWAAGDGGTVVTVTQSHFPGWEAAVAETGVLGWLYTYWTLSLANLVDHVEGRPITQLVDFTAAEMRGEVVIGAPVEAVARSLVDADEYSTWFGARIDIEAWEGGRVAMGGLDANPHPAKVLAYEPGRRMEVDWGGMVSTWELAGSGGGTRLTFVQSGFDEGRPPYGAWAGWLSGVAELRRYHELAGWRPLWLPPEVPGLPEDMLVSRA